jgi:apolipoprotein D and lipocalin family protein
MSHLRAIASALLLMPAAASSASMDVTPVQSLDVSRYMGSWHEIAAIPQFFQRKCVRDTRATYSLDPGQPLIIVENVCTRDDGGKERVLGRARPVEGQAASRLEVTFLDLFGEYRFWVAADYWVIALDPQYRWAVVGHPTRRYGWVLSREPRLAPVVLAEIIGRIKSQGYDACQFVVTPQTGGLSVRRPLCEALP